MNIVYIVVAVIILGVAGYFLSAKSTEAPAELPADPAAEATETGAPADGSPAAAEGSASEANIEPVEVELPESESEAAPEEIDTLTPPPVEEEEPVAASDAPESITLDLTGDNYSFSQEEIRVAAGTEVTINFSSTDGFHDWVVDEFDAATEKVRPGTPTSVTFVADKAGTYEYYCSVGTHRAQGMVGSLIVE